MRNIFKAITIVGLTTMSQLAFSAPVTDTFATGNTLTAAKMNSIKSAVNDNDSRINTLEAVSGSDPDFSGYGVSFSADGAAKNVIVLRKDLGAGDTEYKIRSRYTNSSEQISIDGVLTVRPFIANSITVITNSSGDVTFIHNSIDAPDTANYEAYNIEGSSYDVSTLEKTVTDDTNREVYTCRGSTAALICTGYGTLNASGNFSYIYTFSAIRALGGPYTFNGMTFNDVRMESYSGPSSKARIRAKGIGIVFEDSDSGQHIIIYYQANGSSGGSLAGTPFDTGQPLDGLFF
jgi:hypothetical protein